MAHNTIYQYSTINALMNGYYYMGVSVADMPEHGNFGLGTFEHLDGEMIVLDGNIYKAKSDGTVETIDRNDTSPYVNLVHFKTDKEFELGSIGSFKQLEAALDSLITDKNIAHAIKVRANFSYILVRSVPAQEEPYPPLTNIIPKDEYCNPEEKQKEQKGTLVGFYLPSYFSELNKTGYHFHFISDDLKVAGHVYDCAFAKASVEAGLYRNINIQLPHDDIFPTYNLLINHADLDTIERKAE